jgi:DNA-directed RNA polymerase I subunit RPA2
MIRKLYRLVAGEARPDNPDAPAMQEVLLPGHLLAMMMKESLNELTDAIRINMDIHMRRGGEHNFTDRMSKRYGRTR